MRYHAIEMMYSVLQRSLKHLYLLKTGMLALCGVTLEMARICTIRVAGRVQQTVECTQLIAVTRLVPSALESEGNSCLIN